MVAKGSPDPPDNLHNNLAPPVSSFDNNHSSDSEDDNVNEIDYEGYAPLPIAPNDDRDMIIPYDNAVMTSDSSDNEDDVEEAEVNDIPNNVNNSTPSSSVPHIETVEREVCRELWAGDFKARNIEMNSEKVQEVMSVMANINLPSSSIPDWAKNLTDEEWKNQIVERIKPRGSNS